MLSQVTESLVEVHDLFMLDLDGVVHIGDEAVPGVPDHLARLRREGARLAFVTNNASRPPTLVAERLTGMGVRATRDDVVTSAQAAASLLRDRFGAGARILALGGEGLREALLECGLEPVQEWTGDVSALASGYGPEVLWRDVMRAAVAVRDGLPWVASNTDATIPTPFGVAPGHGVLVRTIADFAGVEPDVAGKPAPPLLRETMERVGGRSPVMVGDRLDTDVLGAWQVGVPSLLVLTGVTGLEELAAAPPRHRPTYLAPTLAGIFEAQPAPEDVGDGHALDGWRSTVRDGRLHVSGQGRAADWWRVAASTAWAFLDAEGSPVDVGGVRPPDVVPPAVAEGR